MLRFGGITVEAPREWQDVRDALEDQGAPFTLAKADGVGALQFSIALYQGGPLPNVTGEQLARMAHDFGSQKDLGTAFDDRRHDGEPCWAGASYHSGEELVRIWYLSDGRNFVLATYVCDWSDRQLELDECEQIVQSTTFH